MATSGSKTIAVTNWDSLVFSWTASSQSVANNTTTVAWTLKLVATSSGYISSSAAKDWSVTVNGTNYSGTNTVGIANNSTKTLASGTTVIKHNNDGTKTFNYSFSQEFAITFSGSTIGTISGSGSGTLNTIARASSLTVSNGTLGTAQTLTISRADSTFKHRIQYSCGSASGYVAGSATGFTTSTSISWTPPLSLASQNTAGTTVKIKFTLGTYTSNGTLVGNYVNKTITCSIPASVKPSCSLTLEDVNGIDDIYGSPVQGLSQIKITVNTTLAYSSPIASYVVTADGKTYTSASATTALLVKSGSSPVTATVKDKRGRTATASYTMNVQAYAKPVLSKLTVHRCDADGKENENGQYAKATFSATVSGLSSKNTATYTLGYKKSTESSFTTKTITALNNVYSVTNHSEIFAADDGSSYDVQVTVTDRHSTNARLTSVSTAFTLMHWNADGTGLAIGKVSEKSNTFEVGLNAEFHGSTMQAGNSFAFQPGAFSGEKGYTCLAAITLNTLNVNAPIVFKINRRGALCPMQVYVRFASSSTTTDPELGSITYEGDNYGAFLVKVATSTWKLYVDNTTGWSNPCLQEWFTTDNQKARMSIAFPDEQIAELPDPYYRATPAKMQSILDYIYPVGSIYMSYSHNNPATMFGGTWVRIENAFLWGCDDSGTIGQTGGENTHTLTVNELPAHSHGSVYSGNVSGTKTHAWLASGGTSMAYGTVATGGGQAHNNMPPYIQVSMWRRTA